jgi:hypothetical protein
MPISVMKMKPGNMSSEIINLNHKGSGDFTSDLFTLKTVTLLQMR